MTPSRILAAIALAALLPLSGCAGGSGGSSATPTLSRPSAAAIPDVRGLDVLGAAARLQRAGFTVTVPRFSLGSQTPAPRVAVQIPAAGGRLREGRPVTLRLEYGCCIASPAVGMTRPLRMPDVVGQTLGAAIRRVRAATGFYGVSVPGVFAADRPLLSMYRVTGQWPRPGFDLRREPHPFRLPGLTVAPA